VAVAKPTAQLTANGAQINCGDSSQLKWTSTDAPGVQINPIGAVASNGDQSVSPKQNTTYQLTATGPGGTVTSDATVNVNTAVQANLDLAPGEVHYRRVGNKVVQNDGSALNWSATNASNATIDPLGNVSTSGNQPIQVTPKQTTPGKIDETVNYTLTATNVCGGTDTKTVALHITGEITNPELQLSRSVYFPTNGPRSLKSDKALVASEQESLTALAAAFKSYLSDVPDAQLVLSGHADKRGPDGYNQKLSERRAELTKKFLVDQGVPEASLSTEAYGKTKNLTADEVKQLVDQNANLSDADKQKALARIQTIVLANNRRVDIGLKGTGQESAKTYPFNSSDYAELVDRGKPVEASSPVENAAEKEKVKN
jgi:outer membrane protein OmpA-like peptidoglycan-associated protein